MMHERQQEMLKHLSEVKFARIEHLSVLFKVSHETIRRDLLELEKNASVKRIRGGAIYSSLRAKELEFAVKMEKNQQQKQAIAKAAAAYISDGDAIAMNNGSTNLALANYLQEIRRRLTVITNSPEIALILSDNDENQIYLTSGFLRSHNKSLVGNSCRDCLEDFRVDKTILSIDGISIKDGVTEYNTEEAAVLRKMLEIGHTRMVLCEFSKFSEVALSKVCSADEIDYVFTDLHFPVKDIRAWHDLGVKVCVSPHEEK